MIEALVGALGREVQNCCAFVVESLPSWATMLERGAGFALEWEVQQVAVVEHMVPELHEAEAVSVVHIPVLPVPLVMDKANQQEEEAAAAKEAPRTCGEAVGPGPFCFAVVWFAIVLALVWIAVESRAVVVWRQADRLE